MEAARGSGVEAARSSGVKAARGVRCNRAARGVDLDEVGSGDGGKTEAHNNKDRKVVLERFV